MFLNSPVFLISNLLVLGRKEIHIDFVIVFSFFFYFLAFPGFLNLFLLFLGGGNFRPSVPVVPVPAGQDARWPIRIGGSVNDSTVSLDFSSSSNSTDVIFQSEFDDGWQLDL